MLTKNIRHKSLHCNLPFLIAVFFNWLCNFKIILDLGCTEQNLSYNQAFMKGRLFHKSKQKAGRTFIYHILDKEKQDNKKAAKITLKPCDILYY